MKIIGVIALLLFLTISIVAIKRQTSNSARAAVISTQTKQTLQPNDTINETSGKLDSDYYQTSTVWIGGTASLSQHTGLYFRDVQIPRGAQIESAILSVYSSQNQWQTLSVELSADSSVNPKEFPALYDWSNTLPLPSKRTTTANKLIISQIANWKSGIWYSLGDLKSVTQELVLKPGWQGKHPIALILKGNGGLYARNFVFARNLPSLHPKLTIRYKTSSPSPLIPIIPTIPQILPGTTPPAPTLTATPTEAPAKIPVNSSQISYGVNFSHIPSSSCLLDNRGIIQFYDQPGNRTKVLSALAEMRRRGISEIRFIFWYDPLPNVTTLPNWDSNLKWGVIPAKDGVIPAKYRNNLIQYIKDIKQMGYSTLNVSFGISGVGNPTNISVGADAYKPASIPLAWKVIQDVRAIAKTYGPSTVRIDLNNESAPSSWTGSKELQQLYDHYRALFSLYVKDYGSNDVTISYYENEWAGKTRGLIGFFQKTGIPMPKYFEIHLYSPPIPGPILTNFALTLQRVETVLKEFNLLGSEVIIGETYHNNDQVAQAIRNYLKGDSAPLRITNVTSWPIDPANPKCHLSAPYSIDQYQTYLGSF